MQIRPSNNSVIYVNWVFVSHTYTMTVNLEEEVAVWALQSLIDWVKFNKQRIVSWNIDDSSMATIDQYDTVRGLINEAIPTVQDTEQDAEQVIEQQAEEVIADIEQSIKVKDTVYALQKKKAKLEAKMKSIKQALQTLEKYQKYDEQSFSKTMFQLRKMHRYFERNLETTYKDLNAKLAERQRK